MNEEWKPILELQGTYEISNLGRIRRAVASRRGNTFVGKIIKVETNHSGYKKLILYRNPRKRFLVHRLVAEAFIPNPENKPHVHHLNHDRTDNRMSNLMWATIEENIGFNYKRTIKDFLESLKDVCYSKADLLSLLEDTYPTESV